MSYHENLIRYLNTCSEFFSQLNLIQQENLQLGPKTIVAQNKAMQQVLKKIWVLDQTFGIQI